MPKNELQVAMTSSRVSGSLLFKCFDSTTKSILCSAFCNYASLKFIPQRDENQSGLTLVCKKIISKFYFLSQEQSFSNQNIIILEWLNFNWVKILIILSWLRELLMVKRL